MPRRQKNKKTKKGKRGGADAGATAAAEGGGGLEEPLLPAGTEADSDAVGTSDAAAGADLEAGTAAAAASADADGEGGAAAAGASVSVASAPPSEASHSPSPRRRPGKQEREDAAVDGYEDDYDEPESEPLLLPESEPVQAELVLEADASAFADRLEAGDADEAAVAESGTVRVVAPATLPPRYSFVAVLPDGRYFTVTVPSGGGVQEGATMVVPYPTPDQILATTMFPPQGYWKDGLLGCCGLGCCHPTLWLSWCCPLVALGQVNTRLHLSWLSNPAPPRIFKWTFTTLVTITLIHFVTTTILSYLGRTVDTTYYRIESVFSLLIVLFRVYTISTARRRVRAKYSIPESACSRGCCCGACRPCEDCCAALFCSCCAVSQMLRHTADYETFRATCCTGTGLPPNAPVVV